MGTHPKLKTQIQHYIVKCKMSIAFQSKFMITGRVSGNSFSLKKKTKIIFCSLTITMRMMISNSGPWGKGYQNSDILRNICAGRGIWG